MLSGSKLLDQLVGKLGGLEIFDECYGQPPRVSGCTFPHVCARVLVSARQSMTFKNYHIELQGHVVRLT